MGFQKSEFSENFEFTMFLVFLKKTWIDFVLKPHFKMSEKVGIKM